jgi:hypothetical protein
MFQWVRRLLQPTRFSSVPAHTADHQAFEAAVASSFRYLTEDYGYTRRPLQLAAYERRVEFDKSDAKVLVEQEIGSEPWVTLAAPKSIARGFRREFGLHELELEMAKLGKYVPTPTYPANIQESLDALAPRLKRVGISFLFARWQRHVRALGKST